MEILIIVLNNEPNAEIEFKPKENFKNINYNLICYISKSTIENNFNVIFPSLLLKIDFLSGKIIL